jgi:hypothetical protein
MCYGKWYLATKRWLRFIINKALKTSVADPDPGSGAFFTPGSGMGKKSRSGIRIRIFPSAWRKKFWVTILKFFDADPDLGSIIFLTGDPGWKKFGSGISNTVKQAMRLPEGGGRVCARMRGRALLWRTGLHPPRPAGRSAPRSSSA